MDKQTLLVMLVMATIVFTDMFFMIDGITDSGNYDWSFYLRTISLIIAQLVIVNYALAKRKQLIEKGN